MKRKCRKLGNFVNDPFIPVRDGYRLLMAKMLYKACRDLLFGKPAEQYDAFDFLVQDGPFYTQALGMRTTDPLDDFLAHPKQVMKKKISPWTRVSRNTNGL